MSEEDFFSEDFFFVTHEDAKKFEESFTGKEDSQEEEKDKKQVSNNENEGIEKEKTSKKKEKEITDDFLVIEKSDLKFMPVESQSPKSNPNHRNNDDSNQKNGESGNYKQVVSLKKRKTDGGGFNFGGFKKFGSKFFSAVENFGKSIPGRVNSVQKNIKKNIQKLTEENNSSASYNNNSGAKNGFDNSHNNIVREEIKRMHRKKNYKKIQCEDEKDVNVFNGFNIHAICISIFDLEIGSKMICTFPTGKNGKGLFDKNMEKRIVGCQIPDGSHFEEIDYNLFFLQPDSNEMENEYEGKKDNKKEFFYGLNCLINQRNEKVFRKYTIKSICFLSKEKSVFFLKPVLKFLLLKIFNMKNKNEILKVLENVYNDLNKKIEEKNVIRMMPKNEVLFWNYCVVYEKDFLLEKFEETINVNVLDIDFPIRIKKDLLEHEIFDERISILRLLEIFKFDIVYLYKALILGKTIMFLGSTIPKFKKSELEKKKKKNKKNECW